MGCIDDLTLFLLSGVDVNIEGIGRHDSISRTPLMVAACQNHAIVCKMLIEKGAKVNVVDR